MQRQRRSVSAYLLAIMVLATTGIASGASIEIEIVVGDLGGRVTFDQQGQDLLVTLENIAPSGATCPEEILTGVYFDLLGLTPAQVASLVRAKGELTPGSWVVNSWASFVYPGSSQPGTDSNGEVGAEYGFRYDLPSSPSLPAGMVITAVGLGNLVGPTHLFAGEELWGPSADAPDGLGYGIVSGVAPTANAKLTSVPLVQDGVIFTLSSLPQGFVLDETNITNVALNYGTDVNVLPLPGAVWGGMMLLGGMGALGFIRRKRSRG